MPTSSASATPHVVPRSSPPRRHSGRVLLAAVPAAIIVLLLIVPTYLVQTPAGDVPPRFVPGSVEENAAPRAPQHISLRVTSLSSGLVELAQPARRHGHRVPVDWFDLDGWDAPPADWDRLSTNRAGATLALTGRFDTIELWFQAYSSPAPVRIELNGQEHAVDVATPDGSPKVFTIASGLEQTVEQRRGVLARFDATGSAGTCTAYEVFVGRVRASAGDACGSATADVAHPVGGPRVLIGGLTRASLTTMHIVLVAVVCLLLGGFIGYAALARFGARPAVLVDATTVLAGVSVLFGLTGALNHVLPVRWIAAPIVLGLAAVAMFVTRRHRPERLVDRRVLVAGLATLAVFALIVTVGDPDSVSLLQTDIYDYQSLTQLFWREGAWPSGSDFGAGMRLLDNSVRSLLYGLGGLQPAGALLAAQAIGWVVVAAAVTRLLRRRRAWVAIGAGLAVAFSAVLIGAYVEGYLTRAFFTCFVLAGWALAAAGLEADGSERRPLLMASGAAFGIAASLVPLYLVPGGAVVLVLAWQATGSVRERLAASYPVLLPAFAVGLPNLLWLHRPDIAARYAEGVNALGTSLVVPFYDQPTAVTAVFGVTPVHATSTNVLGTTTDGVLPALLEAYLNGLDRLAGPVAVVTVVLALATLLGRRGVRRHHATLVWTTWSVVGLGFLALLPFWADQSYVVLMYAWSLAPLLYLTVVLRGVVSRSRWIAIAVGLLVGANVLATTAEVARVWAAPVSSLDPSWRYDVGPVVAALDHRLGELEPGTYSFTTRPSALFQSDDGRTLANLIDQAFTEHGSTCPTCRRAAPTRALEAPPPVADAVAPAALYHVVIGGGSCPGAVVFDRPEVTVCRT